MYDPLSKRFLFLAAAAIVVVTLGYTQHLSSIIREEEQRKVDLWVEAVKQRAELVTYTQTLFEDLGAEEKKRADRLASAYRLIQEAPDGTDLTFAGDFLVNNNTVPVLITNKAGEVVYKVNVDPPPDGVAERAYYDSIRRTQMSRNPPIRFEEVGQTIYYAESVRLRKLREAMDELIESFISETVINSASVPVLLIDSTATRVVKSQGIDVSELDTPEKLQARYVAMAEDNPPISVYLPGEGWHVVFYEESAVLTQLRYFPAVQLLLIAAFLLVAYLVFSASKRAEQNRVWVGMAKETAHQLGTPISSLLGWLAILEEDVNPKMLNQIKSDVTRLETISARFSKIGSLPNRNKTKISVVIQDIMEYMQIRMPKDIKLELDLIGKEKEVSINPELMSWVLENLIKNSIDAIRGKGKISIELSWDKAALISIHDSGIGIPKKLHRTLFEAGVTTKKRGWGIGLTLAKRIVAQYHGGKLRLVNSSNFGTSFEIQLPIA